MWNVIQCAAQGRSHIKTQIPCQDKTYSLRTRSGIVAALADGAGSASLSHFGAEAITKYICRELAENFDSYYGQSDGIAVKKQLISNITDCLSKKATELSCEIKELASTILAVAINNDRLMVVHIGDGVIGYCKNNELKVASEPENGEFTNTTVFTTSKDALMTMRLIKGHLSEISAFILMSDGTEASLYNKQKKHLSESLKKIIILNGILSPEKIQNQLQRSFDTVIRDATTDDCSIVILMDDKGSFRGYRYLTYDKKRTFLGLDSQTKNVIIRQYDSILNYLREKHTIQQIAKHLRIKQPLTKRRVYRLCKLNYLESRDGYYQTLIRMD